MRGTPFKFKDIIFQSGIIPADAGNTIMTPTELALLEDHPRGCGEHKPTPLSGRHCRGSSPRMRGTLGIIVISGLLLGIIPADAGNTSCHRHRAYASEDHPRGCGEHYTWPYGVDLSEGSSPRMRGTRQGMRALMKSQLIIPADAGNTASSMTGTGTTKDHPRGCGEHSAYLGYCSDRRGSSPRMRGTRVEEVGFRLRTGIIPADAGSTYCTVGICSVAQDHPRGCGEHDPQQGSLLRGARSSPRMRGAPRRMTGERKGDVYGHSVARSG